MNIETILAVMNNNEVVVEIRPEKIQARTGFQPMTFAIPVQCFAKWANKPTGSWSSCWFKWTLHVVNNDCKYMKIIYVHCSWRNKYRNHPRTYEHYWSKHGLMLIRFTDLMNVTEEITIHRPNVSTLLSSAFIRGDLNCDNRFLRTTLEFVGTYKRGGGGNSSVDGDLRRVSLYGRRGWEQRFGSTVDFYSRSCQQATWPLSYSSL